MTARKRRKAGKATNPVKTMADYAMSFDRLGLWMAERAKSTSLRHPQATSLSMLDGAVASVVAGPASMNPEEWVCPLLGLGPDAFNHYTEEFSAIAATLIRHNAISNTLSTKPESFEPLFLRRPDGEVDARSWCMGFYAVMKLRLFAWSRLLNPNAIEHGLLLPILFHCVDPAGRPVLDTQWRGPSTPSFGRDAWRDIPTASLQPRASSGCRAGSAGAHSFPQTGAEQGYPHPAYETAASVPRRPLGRSDL
jgi:uncharacterized protein